MVCAGSLDTFQVFVWAVRTARLLDVLAAHEGPVVALAFSPAAPLLASGSWDRTVRTWDVFRRAHFVIGIGIGLARRAAAGLRVVGSHRAHLGCVHARLL